ncbi:uncharacterized protein [Pseudorasbora parva]|uniref:uncharacterized protein n=1 Tax=Pseudorasbora parva TaxID=51549 RepID=UPI00351F52D1
MTTPSASPFADIINSLAVLHQEHHQALLDLRTEQERRFEAIVQGQQEDRERFRSWMDREVRAEAAGRASAPVHVPLQKMGPEDDPEAFVDLFQKAAEACGWPRAQWPVRLIPLLSGEAQAAAQQLPVANLLDYDDLKRAILQRVGRTPEQHRQRHRQSWAGLLAVRRSGSFCGPMSDDGHRNNDPDPGRPADHPRSSRRVPNSLMSAETG